MWEQKFHEEIHGYRIAAGRIEPESFKVINCLVET